MRPFNHTMLQTIERVVILAALIVLALDFLLWRPG
jgi:hypothetical protein